MDIETDLEKLCIECKGRGYVDIEYINGVHVTSNYKKYCNLCSGSGKDWAQVINILRHGKTYQVDYNNLKEILPKSE